MRETIIDSSNVGVRLDKFVLKSIGELNPDGAISRSLIVEYIPTGVYVNNKVSKVGYKLRVGDRVGIDFGGLSAFVKQRFVVSNKLLSVVPSEGSLEVIEESSDWLVINKPSGVAVHPGIGNVENTIANFVKKYLLDKGEYDESVERAGIVHRLDKDVSGLMIIAKTRAQQLYLKSQFEKHLVFKVYTAKVAPNGGVKLASLFEKRNALATNVDKKAILEELIHEWSNGQVDLSNWTEISGFIGRDRGNRKRMRFFDKDTKFVSKTMKKAITFVRWVSKNELLVKIETGRMHQIRATLKAIGLPVVGDRLYGPGASMGASSMELKSVALGIVLESGLKKKWKLI